MQISSNTSTSALVHYRSTGSQGDENTSGVNPTQASARDKQSENQHPATPPITNVDSRNSTQNIPELLLSRVSAVKPTLNDALASSTHSTKMALQTFQQIDLMSEPELMHRVDALA